MLLKKTIPIEDDDILVTVHNKLAPLGAEILLETIDGLKKKSIKACPQDSSKATFAPMINKEDGQIDWKKDATSIRNLIRGMQPWPSAYTHIDGKMLKIFDASTLDAEVLEKPGTILAEENCIVIATGHGKLCVKELQIEGKKRMTAADFLRGHRIKLGTVLG